MNVAISRAKSVCYLAHSPGLLKATFSSLEDVKSVSRLAGLAVGCFRGNGREWNNA